MWTKEGLSELVQEKLKDYLFVVVSNREPYIHTYSGRNIACQVPASGLTVALDPVMRASGGTWVAHGSGDADRETVDAANRVRVPPDDPSYTLKRVWLTKEDEEGFYYGFSNQALWPLCHIVYTKPVFNEADWDTYQRVNRIFAESVLEEIGDRKAFVFIQDYHLALLSRFIKEKSPNTITAQFWHIPWPNRDVFRRCPWQEEIVKGMLGNDLLGFQIQHHCNNFMDTVDRAIEAKVDWERFEITCGGKRTAIRPFPISVDFADLDQSARTPAVKAEMERLREELGISDEKVGIGLDRIDYTKGIPERFNAFERLLQKHPDYRGKVVFIQAGVPSRVHIAAYQALNKEVDELVERINWEYGAGKWKPILLLRENLPPLTLQALRRMADFCVVSSLHDGMNLVAKEYPAARSDEDGVLVLSPFTGAARELTDAIQVNPYATDHFAEAIRAAVDMPRTERRKHTRRMRQVVRENNIYKWAADIITELVKFETGG